MTPGSVLLKVLHVQFSVYVPLHVGTRAACISVICIYVHIARMGVFISHVCVYLVSA